MKTIIGIDPGLSGAVAVLVDGALLTYPMPRNGKAFDAADIADMIRQYEAELVVLEAAQHVRTPAGLSAKATSVLFECQGIVRGACAAHTVRLEVVPPKRWQKAFGIEGDTKAKACALVAQWWPGGKVAKYAADAVCIAEYGRRHLSAAQAAGETR